MKRFLYIAFTVCALVLAGGCIPNDIPYARIPAYFLSLEAKGQDQGTQIDTVNMTATLYFPEEVDIYAVNFQVYTLTPGAEILDNPFGKPVDMSRPLYVRLQLYQTWMWRIEAVQNIERYFEVERQIGPAVIDPAAHRVILYLPEGMDVSRLKVLRAKLGPRNADYTPAVGAGFEFDGSKVFSIKEESFGRVNEWKVYVERVQEKVKTLSADGWSQVGWVTGRCEDPSNFGAEYRIEGSEEWIPVPAADVSGSNASFTACIKHLKPSTSYEARAVSGTYIGETIKFTTGTTPQMPNSNFDQWWQDGRVWNPWLENGTAFWGTGNKGTTTAPKEESNTFPTTETVSGSGWAACLQTKFVGLMGIGRLATGSIFTGEFVRTDGLNGILSFGRPWTERPTRLRGYYKYKGATIDYADKGYEHMKGKPDTCVVWVALIDSPEPLEIRTNPKNRNLFDPNADYVVAYGMMQSPDEVSSYKPFEVEFKYKSLSRKPKYIIVAASAGKYGDFFTGGAGSTMYVDNFELLYDYE